MKPWVGLWWMNWDLSLANKEEWIEFIRRRFG
eukprot:CAMPEP_0118640406 /NCGR_PEP_ID=MMETSP0785-20121206/4739_1 /TAXON_ID=91992 /ORGANISM="Bolidomonas pacifica, Strain CCMP 1866" /LENGTH=31 /DNA_ID= /DNA_START= /DNA_END= /DNA_ORIENTATION=